MDRNGADYSLLDLAMVPEIGDALTDARPTWLWRSDAGAILWANGSGVAWFGAESLSALKSRAFPAHNPAVREIARLAAALQPGNGQLAVLRFPHGVRLEPLACTCRRIVLPDGAVALLVAAAGDDSDRLRLESLARDLLASFEGEGAFAAIYDGAGGLLAHSSGFEALDPVAQAVDGMIAGLTSGTGRTVERALILGDESRPARVARIASAAADLLVMIVGAASPAVESLGSFGPARTASTQPPAPPRPTPPTLADETADGPATTRQPAVAEEPGGTAGASEDDVPIDEPASRLRAESLHPAVPTSPPRAPASAPVAASATGPHRFDWEMDADGRFTALSPELAVAVGGASADLVGRTWPELVAALDLKGGEPVAAAIAARRTWSGFTVYWPVAGRDERIAVDLAALPTYAADRSFAGFRGFGVCRTDDRRSGADTVEPQPAQPAIPVPPASGSAQADTSNIVRLRGAQSGAVTRSERLSGHERDAFRRIAEELGLPVADEPGAADEFAVAGVEAGAPEAIPAPASVRAGLDLRLLDRLPIGVMIFRDQATLFVNRAALDLLGYESVEAFDAGGGIEAVFPGSDNDWSGEAGDRLMARRRDRSEIAVEARLNTTPWGDGLALVLSIYRPPESPAAATSEAPAALVAPVAEPPAAAPDRVRELEAILDTATDGVVLLDGDGLVDSFNRSAEALFGIESAEAVGRPFTDFLAEESRKSALDYLDGLASNGVASLLNDGREVIGKVPKGGLIPLFMTMGRLAASGKFCVVLRDITQWKNAEEELVAARRQAEIANNQKSEFLAKISHEIRTPLNAVIGFSEVMMEERFGPIGSDRYREYLRDIHLSGTHLMSLINDLLDLSKIEAGKLDLKFESVAANAIIQECVALMQPEANRERIIIRTSLSAGLPEIVVDRRSLRQIVLNLVSNAVKFTLPGGQVIVSTTLEDNGEVTIRIRDTGVGMSEKDIDTALTPFRQVNGPGRAQARGTGLGLPLTKALVEANRASFAIDSAVDQGTLVRITFPVTRVLAS